MSINGRSAIFCFDFFFSFRITRTSVNTDVFGRSPEVRVNKVLLYLYGAKNQNVTMRCDSQALNKCASRCCLNRECLRECLEGEKCFSQEQTNMKSGICSAPILHANSYVCSAGQQAKKQRLTVTGAVRMELHS